MDLREIGWKDVYWIHLAHNRDQWQALLNIVMNFKIPQNVGNFMTHSLTHTASQEGLCSVELVSGIRS
jgi:hypothetical protein